MTHGANWQATHGMGDAATCTVCHNGDDCADCHGPGLPHEADFLEVHGEFALGGEAKCGGCHAQAFCSTCHGIEMPHPPQFTPTHAEVAVASLATCERCHAESDCAVCHEKHVHPGGAVGGSSPTGGGGS